MECKERYMCALDHMEESYVNSDKSMRAMTSYNNDVQLLAGLINKHFEPRQETNYEHYRDELAEFFIDNVAVVNGKPKKCNDTDCERDCDLCSTCDKDTYPGLLINWLNQPYKESAYKLTQFEYDLLRTNNRAQGKTLNDFDTYKNLKEIGYFNKLDLDLKIDDILANCEVVG